MRIIIIRHAEPDYEHNTITKQGIIEADALKERLLKENIDYIYVSPLGRALDTASYYVKESKKEYEVLEWLKEFNYPTTKLNGEHHIPWDLPVPFLSEMDAFYDFSSWFESPFLSNSNFKECYENVCQNFDKLLLKHGYQREGKHYKVIKGNKDTLVFFCHLGTECVLLSHLMSIPSIVLAQHFSPAPSSVSILYTEEREKSVAQFRALSLGDVSHLYCKNITPSLMARFRENFEDETEHY